MSSYQLAEPSFNLFRLESWSRLLKFYGINIVVGIAVSIIIFLVMSIFSKTSISLTLLLIVGVVLMGHAYALSLYESWRDCHFLVQKV